MPLVGRLAASFLPALDPTQRAEFRVTTVEVGTKKGGKGDERKGEEGG